MEDKASPKTTPYENEKTRSMMNEDSAKEIIDTEFQEVEQWIKREVKMIKKDFTKLIDSMRVKVDYNELDN